MFKTSLTELRGDELHRLHDAVTDFQKSFHAIMKSKGYERKTSIQSALYDWAYTKGTRRISIDGWHGTGTPGTSRYYGPAKTFFDLYDNGIPGYKAVVHADSGDCSLAELVEQQYKAMVAALKYAATL